MLKGERLIGQNMFMKAVIESDDGRSIPGYLNDVTGVYQTPKGYYVDDADVEEFDKSFPVKEKLRLQGQIF